MSGSDEEPPKDGKNIIHIKNVSYDGRPSQASNISCTVSYDEKKESMATGSCKPVPLTPRDPEDWRLPPEAPEPLAEVEPEKIEQGLISVSGIKSVTTGELLARAREGDLEALVEVTKLTGHYRRYPDSLDYLFSDATGDDRAQASRCCKEISIVLSHEKELALLWLWQWRRLGAAHQDDGAERPRDRRRRFLMNIGWALAVAALIGFLMVS